MSTTTSFERIQQLKTQLANAEKAAIQELMDRRTSITRELADVDADIAKLTGKSVEGKKPRTSASPGRNVPKQR